MFNQEFFQKAGFQINPIPLGERIGASGGVYHGTYHGLEIAVKFKPQYGRKEELSMWQSELDFLAHDAEKPISIFEYLPSAVGLDGQVLCRCVPLVENTWETLI